MNGGSFEIGPVVMPFGWVRSRTERSQGTMLIVVGEAPLLRRPYLYVPRGPVVADPTSPALGALMRRRCGKRLRSVARSC